MKFFLDEDGYPFHVEFTRDDRGVLDSDNFETIRMFTRKLQKIVDYWAAVEGTYQQMKYGELPEEEYKKFLTEKQEEHLGKDLQSGYKLYQIW